MVIMELFGMNGAGKTTVLVELKKHCDIELPCTDIEGNHYVIRNGKKALRVMAVVLNDLAFAMRLLYMMWRKHGWTWDTIACWYNLCYKGYFYLFSGDRKVVLGGGLLHKIWGTYGMYPITNRDQDEIQEIIQHFHCKGGYYLDVPKSVILERNVNRGRATLLERNLSKLDFLYENYYVFVETVRQVIDLMVVEDETLNGRVEVLMKDCSALHSKRFDETKRENIFA